MTDHVPVTNAFSDAEWTQMRRDDFSAARAVVLLMIGIFSTGVILYLMVAYCVVEKIGFIV